MRGVVFRQERETCRPCYSQEHAFMCQRLVLGYLVFGSILMATTVSAVGDEGMWVFNNLPLAHAQGPVRLRAAAGMGRPSPVVGGAVQ